MRMDRLKEGHRMVAHALVQINTKKGKKAPAASRIWPLLTDGKKEFTSVLPTKAQTDLMMKRYFGNGSKPGIKRTT